MNQTERDLNMANAYRLAGILKAELKLQRTGELECYQKQGSTSIRLIVEPEKGRFGVVIGTKNSKLAEVICKLLNKEK